MRIISEYHDFYDGVMAMDQDRELVYNRRISEVDEPLISKTYPSAPGSIHRYHSTWTFQVYSRLVGFCGKVYPVLQLAGKDVKEKERAFAYSVEEVDDFVKAHYKEAEVEAYFSKDWNNKWPQTDRHDRFARFFEAAEKAAGNYVQVFQNHQAPIWVYDYQKSRKRLILNAPLKQLEFYRVVDAFTAYQELGMFYGGMAQPLKEIPVLDDKTMAEIKGHGGKYSFRKPPSK